MFINHEYKFNLSVSTTNYNSKHEISWNKVNYAQSAINLNKFEELIKNGYNFCYNFKSNSITQREKTISNWDNTSVVFIDVDDVTVTMDAFIQRLTMKPTVAYTTYNDTAVQHRFRLVYCFNQVIDNVNVYKRLYKSIIVMSERDNNYINKDNCAQSVNQQFAGNGSDNTVVYRSDVVYDLVDVIDDNIEIEDTDKKYHSNAIIKKEESIIELERHFSNEQYMNDYWHLPFKELLDKYRDSYYIFESTPLDNSNVDVPYILLPDNYIEIKRYWVNQTIYTAEGEERTKVSHARRIKDGEGRRKKLFINGILRRMMLQSISFEHLLNCLVYELYHYVNNRIDTITKKTLFGIALRAYNAKLSDYQTMIVKDKREWIVNTNYCVKYNVNPKQARNMAKKQINYQKIGELFDCSLTDKENVEALKEYGIKISLATLKRFRKDNGIYKNKRSDKTMTVSKAKTAKQAVTVSFPKNMNNKIIINNEAVTEPKNSSYGNENHSNHNMNKYLKRYVTMEITNAELTPTKKFWNNYDKLIEKLKAVSNQEELDNKIDKLCQWVEARLDRTGKTYEEMKQILINDYSRLTNNIKENMKQTEANEEIKVKETVAVTTTVETDNMEEEETKYLDNGLKCVSDKVVRQVEEEIKTRLANWESINNIEHLINELIATKTYLGKYTMMLADRFRIGNYIEERYFTEKRRIENNVIASKQHVA